LTPARRAEEACQELGYQLSAKVFTAEMQEVVGKLTNSMDIQDIVGKLTEKVSRTVE
jgi:hypothetical protein